MLFGNVTTRFAAVVAACVWMTLTAPTSASLPRQDGRNMPRPVVDSVVSAFASLMLREHVRPTVAREMVERVRARAASGAYTGVSRQDFARRITADLREVSGDRHMRVELATSAEPQPSAPTQVRRRPSEARSMFGELRMLPGKVAVVEILAFVGNEQVIDSVLRIIRDADALIIDVRRAPGGMPQVVDRMIGHLIARPTLTLLRYGRGGEVAEAWARPVAGSRPEVPVFIATSGATASAAESFTHRLKHLNRATVVGERTRGAGLLGGMRDIGHGFQAWISQSEAVHPISGTGFEGAGVAPDVAVAASDAVLVAHVLALRTIAATLEDANARADVLEKAAAVEKELGRKVAIPDASAP